MTIETNERTKKRMKEIKYCKYYLLFDYDEIVWIGNER